MHRDPITVGPDETLAEALRLARVVRILGEELGLNIVSVVVPSVGPGATKIAILRIGTIDPREAIEALHSAGYQAGWPSLEWSEAAQETR